MSRLVKVYARLLPVVIIVLNIVDVLVTIKVANSLTMDIIEN